MTADLNSAISAGAHDRDEAGTHSLDRDCSHL